MEEFFAYIFENGYTSHFSSLVIFILFVAYVFREELDKHPRMQIVSSIVLIMAAVSTAKAFPSIEKAVFSNCVFFVLSAGVILSIRFFKFLLKEPNNNVNTDAKTNDNKKPKKKSINSCNVQNFIKIRRLRRVHIRKS